MVISKARRTEEFLLTSGETEAGRAAAKEPAGKFYRKQRGIERSEDYVVASCVSEDGMNCSINVGSVFKATEPRIAIEVHGGEAVSTLELELEVEVGEGKEEATRPDGAGR